jgi:hypothetical protein
MKFGIVSLFIMTHGMTGLLTKKLRIINHSMTHGMMTFSIMTLSIITHGKMAFKVKST